MKRMLVVFFLSISGVLLTVTAQQCTLCIDGSNNYTSSRSDFLITLPGFPTVSCTTAVTLAGLVPATSTECSQAQALGSPLCGCSILQDDPCLLCPPLPTTETEQPSAVTTIEQLSLPQEGGSVPQLSSVLFDSQVLDPSCELVQAVLLNFARTSETCQTSLEQARKNCVCSNAAAVPATGAPTTPTRNETTDDTSTPSSVVQRPTTINENKKCTLCRSGATIQFPDREIAGFVTPTCGILDTVTATLDADSSECWDAQAFGLFCGCPDIPDDRCTLCVDGSDPLYPDTTIDYIHLPNTDKYAPTCAMYDSLIAGLSGYECNNARGAGVLTCGCPAMHETTCVMCPGGIAEDRYLDTVFDDDSFTCRQLESMQYADAPNDYNCRGLTYYADRCGCRDGVRTFGGVETRLDQIILSWAPRPSALLSLVGSFSILYSVFKSRKTMYHQIMIGLSVGDILSSGAWLVSNAAVPKDEGLYGTMGNTVTCRLQGLLTIFTLSSLWYNLSLSIYYKLVIIDGWQESKLKKPLVRFCLLGIPALIGLCLSLSSYTHIVEHPIGCTIIPWPWESQGIPFVFILFLPSLIPVIAVPYITMYVCARFTKQTKASQRWRLSAQTQRSSGTLGANTVPDRRNVGRCSSLGQFKSRLMSDSLDSKVLRQSLFYLVAFLACFPIGAVYTILGFFHIYPYRLSVLLMILVPLQGFNNAIVFFRPRVLTMCQKRKKKQTNKATSPPTAPKHQKPFENKMDETSKVEADEVKEKKDFLRSHFIEDHSDEDQSDEDHIDEDRFDDDLADAHDATKRTMEENVTETVLVGSFVLPTHRGSVVWNAVNWDEEVSDYMYKEEEEEEEPSHTRRSSTLPTPTTKAAAHRLRHSMPPIVRGNKSTQ